MMTAVVEPDRFQQALRRLVTRATLDPERSERGLHVLCSGQGGDQVELLEDEPEGAEPEVSQLRVFEPAEVAALEQHLARAGAVEPAEELKQRCLPGAARPRDREEFALLDRKIDVAHGPDRGRSLLVRLGYAV